MIDCPDDFSNDPDGYYAHLATSILDEVRECKEFQQLHHLLLTLLEPRSDAVAIGDQLEEAIYSYFLDGALFALLTQLPQPSLRETVEQIGESVRDGLESWDIKLVAVPEQAAPAELF